MWLNLSPFLTMSHDWLPCSLETQITGFPWNIGLRGSRRAPLRLPELLSVNVHKMLRNFCGHFFACWHWEQFGMRPWRNREDEEAALWALCSRSYPSTSLSTWLYLTSDKASWAWEEGQEARPQQVIPVSSLRAGLEGLQKSPVWKTLRMENLQLRRWY